MARCDNQASAAAGGILAAILAALVRAAALAALVATLLLVTAPARAESPTSPEARELTEQGRRAYNLGHWQESIDRFERAYQINGDPALLFNLAQARRQAGQLAEALHAYRAYLRERPNGANRDVAEKQIRDLERRVPQAEAAPALTPPPPAAAAVAPAVAAPAVAAAPVAAAPAPARAPTVTATATPPAPAPQTPRPAGAAALVQTSPPPPVQPRGAPIPRWLPWVGAALTLALAGGAVFEGLASNKRYDELKNGCGQYRAGCSDSDIDSVRSLDRRTTALWAVAGVAAVGTGVLFYANAGATGVAVAARF